MVDLLDAARLRDPSSSHSVDVFLMGSLSQKDARQSHALPPILDT